MMTCTEVAIAVVIGVYDDGVDDDFGVDHDEHQLVFALGYIIKLDLQPADVVEDLIATEHLSAILPFAKQQIVV